MTSQHSALWNAFSSVVCAPALFQTKHILVCTCVLFFFLSEECWSWQKTFSHFRWRPCLSIFPIICRSKLSRKWDVIEWGAEHFDPLRISVLLLFFLFVSGPALRLTVCVGLEQSRCLLLSANIVFVPHYSVHIQIRFSDILSSSIFFFVKFGGWGVCLCWVQ